MFNSKGVFTKMGDLRLQKSNKGDLYNLAKMAKRRLSSNNYSEAKIMLVPKPVLTIMPKKELAKPVITVINNKDELLYQRVCDLLTNGRCFNPVGELIDQKVFSSLDMEAKQKYIYSLTDKFKQLKLRYYREHPYNFSV